ncbi:STAS domain-containing protein [Micromonospora sp. WMMD956]|uniref:STAS domain-containing protein n=1 Tax=Micromonospora TaxID=1873 RepID=UPI0024176091|nr:STAS domain-containing protein [Micromonospora sp. WMMD956]MDG4819543.1 STAS domain-containing protein [Micromonospora sp. WMMD956]
MTTPLARRECTIPLVEVAVTEFDLACLPETGAVFDRLLALRPAQVVVDLSACRHIDAAAIGFLLDVHRRLTRADGVLVVREPNPRIRRILQSARLDQVLPVVVGDAAAGSPEQPGPVAPPVGRAVVPGGGGGSRRPAPAGQGRARRSAEWA